MKDDAKKQSIKEKKREIKEQMLDNMDIDTMKKEKSIL